VGEAAGAATPAEIGHVAPVPVGGDAEPPAAVEGDAEIPLDVLSGVCHWQSLTDTACHVILLIVYPSFLVLNVIR